MTDSRATYIRKSDGVEVKVIMEPVGWGGWKKVYERVGLAENVVRVPNDQFEKEYTLPKASMFARLFRRGIK